MTNLITLAIGGIPMIIKAVNCLPKADKYVFVCREEHIKKFNLDKILSDQYPNVEIVTVTKTTEGSFVIVALFIVPFLSKLISVT